MMGIIYKSNKLNEKVIFEYHTYYITATITRGVRHGKNVMSKVK